jgi:hypothetical protein
MIDSQCQIILINLKFGSLRYDYLQVAINDDSFMIIFLILVADIGWAIVYDGQKLPKIITRYTSICLAFKLSPKFK